MNEALEKVRGVNQLPIFPLAVVLFPGVPLPLHIFEPRYRKMLRDVRFTNNLFGVSYFDAGESSLSRPPVGHVGCATEIIQVEQLPDGRSNILTVGVARYRVASYVEADEPYLVARVEFFEDEEEDPAELDARAKEVTALFTRIAKAVRKLNDERASLPELPEVEPERLSFMVAAAMEMEAEAKQEMLEMRSTLQRLARIRDLLAQVVSGYEERARMHGVAKTNGHGGKKINLE
jgi:ATP-dependent Lon protease